MQNLIAELTRNELLIESRQDRTDCLQAQARHWQRRGSPEAALRAERILAAMRRGEDGLGALYDRSRDLSCRIVTGQPWREYAETIGDHEQPRLDATRHPALAVRLFVMYFEGDFSRQPILDWPDPTELAATDQETNRTMSPDKIKEARQKLGLTQAQLGAMLDTDGQTIRRMEMDPGASTFREPAPRMVRLIEAYLAGYRPEDWPIEERDA